MEDGKITYGGKIGVEPGKQINMKITKIKLNSDKLLLLDENERVFFVIASVLANEIAILHKLIIYSSTEQKHEVLIKAHNTQLMFIIKLLAGLLFEGWLVLQKDYFGAKLSKEYDELLTDIGKESIQKIKRYFSRDNYIDLIRNKFAFHYDSVEIKNDMHKLLRGEELELYLAEDHANCLNFMAHVITNNALLRRIDEKDPWNSIDIIFKDVLSIARYFLDFIGDIFFVFFRKHKELESIMEEIDIPIPPGIDSISLPYFVGEKGDGLNLPQFDGHLKMGTIDPKGVSDEKEEGI
jgi:hypothetical protein